MEVIKTPSGNASHAPTGYSYKSPYSEPSSCGLLFQKFKRIEVRTCTKIQLGPTSTDIMIYA